MTSISLRRISRRLVPAAVAALMVALSGCGAFPGAAPLEPIVVDGNSQFTTEGVQAIRSSGQVSFDLTEVPMPMTALGFAKDSDGTLIEAPENRPFDVTITTPGGVLELKTHMILIRPGADQLVSHIEMARKFEEAQDANAEIARARDEIGVVALENAEPYGPDFIDGSEDEQWYPGAGNRTGTVFSVAIYEHHDDGGVEFVYTAELSPEYYTPEAEATIAETGDLP